MLSQCLFFLCLLCAYSGSFGSVCLNTMDPWHNFVDIASHPPLIHILWNLGSMIYNIRSSFCCFALSKGWSKNRWDGLQILKTDHVWSDPLLPYVLKFHASLIYEGGSLLFLLSNWRVHARSDSEVKLDDLMSRRPKHFLTICWCFFLLISERFLLIYILGLHLLWRW